MLIGRTVTFCTEIKETPLLRAEGLQLEACYTSVLRRATDSAQHCLVAMDRPSIPVRSSWRLNERHYGALQGLDKAETVRRFGQEQVRMWRRSFGGRPPAADALQQEALRRDARYAQLRDSELPAAESIHDVLVRLRPLWEQEIVPELARGRCLLVIAHGATMRAFARLLGGASAAEAESLEFANGVPLVHELDGDLRPMNSRPLVGARPSPPAVTPAPAPPSAA